MLKISGQVVSLYQDGGAFDRYARTVIVAHACHEGKDVLPVVERLRPAQG